MARVGETGAAWDFVEWRPLASGLVAIVALLMGFVPAAAAFHRGGVGACDGCHDLHPAESTESMLRSSDISSTCLRCHAEMRADYNIRSVDGTSFTAGGDFYWLGQSYSWFDDGQVFTSPASGHGHNVVASDYGLSQDPTRRHRAGWQLSIREPVLRELPRSSRPTDRRWKRRNRHYRIGVPAGGRSRRRHRWELPAPGGKGVQHVGGFLLERRPRGPGPGRLA